MAARLESESTYGEYHILPQGMIMKIISAVPVHTVTYHTILLLYSGRFHYSPSDIDNKQHRTVNSK